MKKVLALLTLLIFAAAVCSAQQLILEKNDLGEYRVSSITNWQSTGITVEGRARHFRKFFPQTLANPGDSILIGETTETVKLKPVFSKLEKVTEWKIVYDDSKKTINVIESIQEREGPSYLILFSIASLIAMIISNILFKRKESTNYITAFSIVAFAFALLFVAITTNTIIGPTTMLIVFPGLFAAVCAACATLTSANKTAYKSFSSIYYILMIAHVILLFT